MLLDLDEQRGRRRHPPLTPFFPPPPPMWRLLLPKWVVMDLLPVSRANEDVNTQFLPSTVVRGKKKDFTARTHTHIVLLGKKEFLKTSPNGRRKQALQNHWILDKCVCYVHERTIDVEKKRERSSGDVSSSGGSRIRVERRWKASKPCI